MKRAIANIPSTCNNCLTKTNHWAHGMCKYHYYRWYRTSSPERLAAMKESNRKWAKKRREKLLEDWANQPL